MFLERQLQLLGAVAVDVGHREPDQRQAALGDQRRGGGNQCRVRWPGCVGGSGGARHGVDRVARPKSSNRSRSTTVRPVRPAVRIRRVIRSIRLTTTASISVADIVLPARPERALRADRAAPHARHHPAAIDVAGQRKQLMTHRAADHGCERRLAELGDIGDRLDAVRVQLLGGLHADAPQPPHRQRVQECQFTIRRNQQQPVRLGLLAGDLGQELRARDADGDGQPDAVADLRAQPGSDLNRGARHPPQARHIEEGLVHRQRFDHGCGVVEHLEHRCRWPRNTPTSAAAPRSRADTAPGLAPPIAVRTP